MVTTGLRRTDYWNRVTGSVRSADTRHDETVTNIESFVLPYLQTAAAGLHLWGVADGYTIAATPGQAGIGVGPGSAVDTAGHLIVMTARGVVVTDPDTDPTDVANIATVPVDAAGVSIATARITGDRYLTARYLEAGTEGLLGNAPTLVHAPWLRLVDVNGFSDDRTDVVLAQATIAAGAVTALTSGPRRLTGFRGGRVQLRRPVAAGGATLGVRHSAGAELHCRPHGGVDVGVLPSGSPPKVALTVDPGGNVGIGTATPQRARCTWRDPKCTPAGAAADSPSTDRNVGSFVNTSTAGQRFVWYALDGSARLWSGADVLTSIPTGVGNALNVGRRMRVRQGSDSSAGIWFFQSAPNADRAFVGMVDDNRIGLFGTGVGWVLTMNTSSGNVEVGGSPQFGSVDARLYERNDRTNPVFPTPTAVMGEAQVGHGVRAKSATGIGLYASGGQWAALFEGNIHVSGTITKGAVQFKIDHPLDPGRKFLQHSAVEVIR